MPDGAIESPGKYPKLASFRKTLGTLVRAHYPLIQLITWEEQRAVREIKALAAELNRTVTLWTASQGIHRSPPTHDQSSRDYLTDLAAATEQFEAQARKGGAHLFVMLDPAVYLNDRSANPVYRRRLRDFCSAVRDAGLNASLILVGTNTLLPSELEHEAAIIDLPLPERDEVNDIVRDFVARMTSSGKVQVVLPDDGIEKISAAVLGLDSVEIHYALARTVVSDHRLDTSDIFEILRSKQNAVRKNGVLEFIDAQDLSIEQIGGLNRLKMWLERRRLAFTQEAQQFGIPTPKGVLVTGVPGTGKSWAAKCVGASWKVPLIRLDLGRIYASLVGDSELNMRKALSTCEAVAPCVLWIDEIEKGAPRPGHHNGDSGVSQRVLGTFLTWLQEKTAPVFVFATANDVTQLVPEMLRRGRFDEVFFVDLPGTAERREILEIQFRRFGRDPADFDLDVLSELAGPTHQGNGVSFTGAEIEAWIVEALLTAFARGSTEEKPELRMSDLEDCIGLIAPIAKLRGEYIDSLRHWAVAHTLSATGDMVPAHP